MNQSRSFPGLLALLLAFAVGCGTARTGSGDGMDMSDTTMVDMDMPDTTMVGMPDDAMDGGAGVMVGGAMMLPTQTLVENASEASNLTTAVAAVQAAGLVETLNGAGPFTVFAPTNMAFDALPAGTVDTLMAAENQARLQAVLTYHVVPGRISTDQLSDGQMLTTVNGAQLEVSVEGGEVMVGGARIETPNVYASNGVAHVIDAVLLPPGM